jgi:asparagine N-glycosylation enzyme membrane subunit Stt3
VEKTSRSRKSLLVALLVAILVLSVLVSLKVDFDNRDRLFQNLIKDSPDGMEAFEKLSEVTPSDAVILSWWDYGRAIQEFGGRRPVVAYPSKDILQSVGETQNPIYALEMQLFGTYEPPDKIHDVARSLLLPEDESLSIMKKYAATHVMIFDGEDELGAFNDLEKLPWIARIAGYNASDYVRVNTASRTPTYELTPKAEQATILRLLFDAKFHPQHFTKIYENSVAKIYRIEYSASQSTGSPEPLFQHPDFASRAPWSLSRVGCELSSAIPPAFALSESETEYCTMT